ncbi:MAG TPA: DUF2950 family protein [Planctomycetota bacterium]
MTLSARRVPLRFWIYAVAVVVGLGLLWPSYAHLFESQITKNEREVCRALKLLADAQADFRGNDRDGNKIQDFWTADVAGLFYLTDRSGAPIQLIDRKLAAADAFPLRPVVANPEPYHGYFIVAMTVDEEGRPYRQHTGGEGAAGAENWNHSRFAFCAYPAKYGVTGVKTFFNYEGHSIFWQRLEGASRMNWFSDEEMRKIFPD